LHCFSRKGALETGHPSKGAWRDLVQATHFACRPDFSQRNTVCFRLKARQRTGECLAKHSLGVRFSLVKRHEVGCYLRSQLPIFLAASLLKAGATAQVKQKGEKNGKFT